LNFITRITVHLQTGHKASITLRGAQTCQFVSGACPNLRKYVIKTHPLNIIPAPERRCLLYKSSELYAGVA
jgi:hypothetical protein